ncbi:MAG: tetratricopeptide repeat protein [Sandaracinaceae bacterium]|nr:tetratricopeptide repeat protein [Sandaracinaceae bacterium]
MEALQAALARDPEQPQFNMNLATIYRRQQRWAQAVPHYEAALRGTNDTGAMFDLAYCYEQLHRRDDAVRMYRRYIQAVGDRDPDGAARAEERLNTLGE